MQVAGAFGEMILKSTGSRYAPLRAENVDMLTLCGGVDPDPFLPEEVRRVAHDPASLFDRAIDNLPCDSSLRGVSRAEYILLVRRQCRARKIGLSPTARDVAPIFCVPKRDPRKLREVWNGSEFSSLTCVPPCLPFMATPAALSTLESSDDRPLLFSSRDGAAFFDQLRLPEELRPYAGRPSVTVAELCESDYKGAKHPIARRATGWEGC